ncbi:hypothetical protein PRIC2_004224, partial [Phytophthora ramorum]
MWTLRHSVRRAPTALPQRRALTAAAIAQGKVPIDNLFVTSTEKFAKVGYFRPIQPSAQSSMADHHVEVMREQLGLTKEVHELFGVSSERAIESWLSGKEDDLVEEILDRFEQCREGHDFMIIEGSQLSKHESAMSWKVNVDIAKAIGSPVLTISDFSESTHSNGELLEEILSRTALNKDQVEGAGLNFIGNIANRVNTKDPKALRDALRSKLNEKDLPFLGFLPKDDFIASKRLNEVTHQLGATQLFGTKAIPNNVVVTSAVVATSALKDLFSHLKNYKDGALVITSADRSDIMLGLMASRLPGILPNVSAIVLTNGSYPHSNTQEILKGDTFTTADKFSKVSTDILPTSQLKIDRSKQLFDEFVGKENLIGELDEGMVVNRSPSSCRQVLRQKLSKVTILGNPDDIQRHAKSLNLDLSRANIKRKHKGVTRETARDAVLEETCFGTMMVEMGDADGMVSGACHTTANTIRPALQLIKTTPNRPIVSSVFFMCLEDGVRIYGDCAVNTDPSAADLAQIAVTSAESAEAFGLIPKVALLSYATGDSNSGPIIDKVREATKIAQELRPDLDIYGPIQYDAAVDASIAKTKLKAIPSGAKVGGQAR